jgi:hypothetical protein
MTLRTASISCLKRSSIGQQGCGICLLVFVPLANLVFWFLPGTDGSNRYGPPPPPNSALVVALVPILLVVVMASVAIPAYKSFMERSRAAQQR